MRRLSDDWRDIQLTENLKLGEFVVSSTHPEIAAQIKPTIEQANNLYLLSKLALQKIRDEYGVIVITSGLVTEELNLLRGSKSTNSQHLFGEAVDFVIPGVHMLDPFIFAKHELEWPGELIYYKKRGHVHIALPSIWSKPNYYIEEN